MNLLIKNNISSIIYSILNKNVMNIKFQMNWLFSWKFESFLEGGYTPVLESFLSTLEASDCAYAGWAPSGHLLSMAKG